MSILAFNFGVEIGQLAILAILLPVLTLLSNTTYYTRGVLPVGSLLIAIMAVQWGVERW
ncbi:HupE/UreJ family protein [Colwellia sp. MB3u-28]|nr:HupE/UreJ family protein [Colwellia sp. MB02u-7]MBA6236774.1 HupE/UreJ family protein [Colwellia sp. MB02u-11]MBA6255966.1 HupE/UreJ family protein [Colwellia sp. MB3u-28]MBA6259135.1 HupE/UreJ family protein [Colwellia sp. MB3u-41]MBA6299183.1 HupE/UreJ family protein [Colwellia sp. MB3u-22]MBA6304899.1 HupE/UreJ family protein [Colwellia sp. MB02u-14]MBA6310440.1 HupE/UreJ family protein [Colwellia sp. MB3u-64]